jgi:phosphohistidine phosphatase
MELLLWRHADSPPAKHAESDLDRPLSFKGAKQAHAMAKWIDHRLPASARVLVSPARRAQETAERLGRKISTVDSLAPGCLAAHVLLAANWPDCRHPVVVVGHQPALGRAAALLLLGQEQDLSLKKCGLLWISTKSRKDLGDADVRLTLRAALCPELL